MPLALLERFRQAFFSLAVLLGFAAAWVAGRNFRAPALPLGEKERLEKPFPSPKVPRTVQREDPSLFDAGLWEEIRRMMREAVDCEMAFAQDVLGFGVIGLSPRDMQNYLEFIADQRLLALGDRPLFGSRNPFGFMDLQDTQELTNFFERRVSAYQVNVTGDVAFNENF